MEDLAVGTETGIHHTGGLEKKALRAAQWIHNYFDLILFLEDWGCLVSLFTLSPVEPVFFVCFPFPLNQVKWRIHS